MSARGLVFSFDPTGGNPDCDVCGMPTSDGAVMVHRERRPGVALHVSCLACAVELACVTIREAWPRSPPDPPPETPPGATGGGSS